MSKPIPINIDKSQYDYILQCWKEMYGENDFEYVEYTHTNFTKKSIKNKVNGISLDIYTNSFTSLNDRIDYGLTMW